MTCTTDMTINEIVAACDGDAHGALEALLLVNEQLEAEIHQLYSDLFIADHEFSALMTIH
jgi:hypothetical protein